MSKNGLTPMGRYLDKETTDRLKLWDKEFKDRLKSNNKADSSCFGVLTILNDQVYFKSAVMTFNSEHEAIDYCDNWIKSGKGYAKLLTPKN